MVVVALISAFIAMRLAIHGREGVVPPLTGLPVAQATAAAAQQGLHLTVENRFYSADVPVGRVISQDPPAGFHVRRDWPIRITESLGSPRVAIPNLVGQSERAALISIRQLGLEPSAVIHMPVSGEENVVIAQTPAPNAGEMTSPRISLLVSDAGAAHAISYVMPSLVGLTYLTAKARIEAAGLHLSGAETIPVTQAASGASLTATSSVAAEQVSGPAPPASGTVTAQSPAAGSQVQSGGPVRIVMSQTGPAE